METVTARPETLAPLTTDELIARYGEAVPRYTSYPPANRFSDEFAGSALGEDLSVSKRPLSLYVHIPFCAQRCYFCGCNTELRRRYGDTARYVDGLIAELEAWAARLGKTRPLVDIHWGGGTPTFLKPEEIHRLGQSIHRSFQIADEARFSVEVDPRHLSVEQAAALAGIGCNRASLGVQDTDPTVQAAINRVQPMAVNRTAVSRLREAGIQALNIDLIYGLPHQTAASFDRTLDDILELEPDRLAIFGYAHLPSLIPVQRVIERRGGLPGPQARYALMRLAIRRLTEAGYQHLGLDHFARPEDSLARAARKGTLHRNFNGYTDCPDTDLLGIGPSAISESARCYAQNEKQAALWLAKVEAGESTHVRGLRLDEDDELRRALIRAVLSQPQFERVHWVAKWGPAAGEVIDRALGTMGDLAADGLLVLKSEGYTLTPLGRLFNRAVAHRFDARYASASTPRAKHAPGI